MSRVGKTPIDVPAGVTVTEKDGQVTVVGPKGNLTLLIPDGIKTQLEANKLEIRLTRETGDLGSIHGLFRTLVQNSVTGVTKGWEKTVELVGVGYKAAGGGAEVTLNVGFTHPVKMTAPVGITFKVDENTKITISGIDKKMVGEVAAKLRAVKPPEPYKGKGIRYVGEVVRKKAGKAVKAAGAPA